MSPGQLNTESITLTLNEKKDFKEMEMLRPILKFY